MSTYIYISICYPPQRPTFCVLDMSLNALSSFLYIYIYNHMNIYIYIYNHMNIYIYIDR